MLTVSNKKANANPLAFLVDSIAPLYKKDTEPSLMSYMAPTILIAP